MSATSRDGWPGRWQSKPSPDALADAREYLEETDVLPLSGFHFSHEEIQRFILEVGQFDYQNQENETKAIHELIDWAGRIHPTIFTPALNGMVIASQDTDGYQSEEWLAIDKEQIVKLEDME